MSTRFPDMAASDCYLAVELNEDGTSMIHGWSDAVAQFTGIDLSPAETIALATYLAPVLPPGDSKSLARNIAALVDRYYQTAKDEGDRAALVNLASLMRHATAYIMVMSTELEEWAKAESIALDERDEWMRKYEELADENDELRRQLPDYEVTR